MPQNLQSDYQQPATFADFAALAVALYETVTGTEITGRVNFSDTDDVNLQKVAYLGVVDGLGASDEPLMREKAAAMLSRLAKAINEPLPTSAPTFVDNNSISSWALDGVGQMQAAGIMGCVGNNNFAPQGDYTREQSIITILRLFDVVNANYH